jgi:hypothetical protein
VEFQVTFDAASPEKLARFWALALGYADQPLPPGFSSLEEFFRSIGMPEEKLGDYWALVDPVGAGPRLYFERVPEPKTAKNRMHLDVRVADRSVTGAERDALRAEHVARLVAAGGTLVREVTGEQDHPWTVMQDPEGNEFCVA